MALAGLMLAWALGILAAAVAFGAVGGCAWLHENRSTQTETIGRYQVIHGPAEMDIGSTAWSPGVHVEIGKTGRAWFGPDVSDFYLPETPEGAGAGAADLHPMPGPAPALETPTPADLAGDAKETD